MLREQRRQSRLVLEKLNAELRDPDRIIKMIEVEIARTSLAIIKISPGVSPLRMLDQIVVVDDPTQDLAHQIPIDSFIIGGESHRFFQNLEIVEPKAHIRFFPIPLVLDAEGLKGSVV